MIKKIRTKDFLSWSLFLCSLAISQTYLNNYYDVTSSPDFRRYFDYFLYFNGDLNVSGLEQGIAYYFLCYLVFSKNTINLNFYNFEEILTTSILEANFYFYVLSLLGLYKLFILFKFKNHNILLVLAVLNLFPPSVVLRIIFKPEVMISTLFIWTIYFTKVYIKKGTTFNLIVLASTLSLISSMKISSTVIVFFALTIIFIKDIFKFPKKTVLIILTFFLFFIINIENYSANGLLLHQHIAPAGYKNTADLGFVINLDINHLIQAPVRNEHANSFISILLLDTFDDYFRLFWSNDESAFYSSRVNIYNPYMRQYFAILLSSIFYLVVISSIFTKNKLKKFISLPLIGIFFMLLVSLFIQFDPTTGDMMKNYYYGFLLTISFASLFLSVKSYNFKILITFILIPILIFIFGFPKTSNDLINEKVSFQNQFSNTCFFGSKLDIKTTSGCYNFENQYCEKQFSKEEKLDFVNGVISLTPIEIYKNNLINVYKFSEDYILKNKETCIFKIDELKVRKYKVESSYPLVNSILILTVLFGIFATQIKKE